MDKLTNLFKRKNTRSDNDGSTTTANNNKPDDGNFLVDCPNLSEQFAKTLSRSIYTKILTECSTRAAMPDGVESDVYQLTAHDSYSPFKMGLVSIVVDALINQKRVYYRVVRYPDFILFEKANKSDFEVGENGVLPADIIEFNFEKFHEVKVVNLLLEVLELLLQAMSKKIAVSSAILIKLYKLSELISNDANIEALDKQIVSIKEHFLDGDRVVIDSESDVTFVEYSTSDTEAGTKFIFNLTSSVMGGMPVSSLFGDIVGGLGNGDNGDSDRENTAIRRYFLNIWSGVCYSVWSKTFKYQEPKMSMDDLTKLFALVETTTLLDKDYAAELLSNESGYPVEAFNVEHLYSSSDNNKVTDKRKAPENDESGE